MDVVDLTAERRRLGLAADCGRCFGLCCVAHSMKSSAAFAIDKPAGKPCPNLLADFGCNIHRSLRQQGFSGCTAYTCYGAGQKVAQELFGGIDWRQAPETAELMFQTLPIVRQLHELMWFATEALDRCESATASGELLVLLAQSEQLAAVPAAEMSWGDVDDHCRRGEDLLGKVSAAIRAVGLAGEHQGGEPGRDLRGADLPHADLRGADLPHADLRGADLPHADLRGADLRGADLRGADLRGADLWGAQLSGADLSGADLRWADLMGADLDRANFATADLSAAIFLSQSQLELAQGNPGTRVSDPLQKPARWC